MPDVAFDPTRYEVQRDPYPHYRRLRDDAPVYRVDALQAYALTRYDDCKYTFMHPELYSARDFIQQAFGDLDPVPEVPSIIAMDPPEHTPLRKLASQGFKPSLIRDLEPKIEAIVDALLDDVEASARSRGNRFDFVNDFAAYVPVSTTAELLGVDPSQRENFKVWTSDLLKAANRASLAETEVAGIRASVAKLRAYLEGEIAARGRAPKDDFLSLLVAAEEDGDKLTPIEVLRPTGARGSSRRRNAPFLVPGAPRLPDRRSGHRAPRCPHPRGRLRTLLHRLGQPGRARFSRSGPL
jgi:cytochrome P450